MVLLVFTGARAGMADGLLRTGVRSSSLISGLLYLKVVAVIPGIGPVRSAAMSAVLPASFRGIS